MRLLNNYVCGGFTTNLSSDLSFDNLRKFIDNDNQIQKNLELKNKLDTKSIDNKLQNGI